MHGFHLRGSRWFNAPVLSTGSLDTALVILRGSSSAETSATAKALQRRYKGRVAVVSHDVVRRTILRVPCREGNPAIGLIDRIARYALDEGFHVVVEGPLPSETYGPMLARLADQHAGLTRFYRYDLPFEESLHRHHVAASAQAAAHADTHAPAQSAGTPPPPAPRPVDVDDLRPTDDVLDFVAETVLGEDLTEDDVVRLVAGDLGW